jgi:tRNA A37 threonylcarbamoyladenosine biosynthesis protein TsaE
MGELRRGGKGSVIRILALQSWGPRFVNEHSPSKSFSGGREVFSGRRESLGTIRKWFCTAKKSFRTTEKSFRTDEKSLGTNPKWFRTAKKWFCTTEKSLGTAKKWFCTAEKSLGTAKKWFCTTENLFRTGRLNLKAMELWNCGMSDNTRLQLFDAVKDLPSPEFDRLLYALGLPKGIVSDSKPQGSRTKELLDWAEGSTGPGLEKVEQMLLNLKEQSYAEQDIDALVQDIRQKVHDDIHNRCGTMRVLDMEQPIGIDDIYTNVNILEKLSGRRRLGLNELLQDCDLENFDRFVLGQVRNRRVPGLEAVERYNKLMILGKPGAGKTTFMKRLATLCNQGEFQAQRVPVFVTLKEFAEALGKPDLQAYIANQWQTCGVAEANAITAVLLSQGNALVLLDGLDEVQEDDHDRVLQTIQTFTDQYRHCQFVMTCRIAAREYTFQQFTEVEVADFNDEQIAEFANKWFKAKQDPEKSESFIQRLEANKPIQELATNPLLLTLLCLVFGEAADFPENRAELYKEGLDVLLKKWDAKRNIERDQVYKKLSLKRKEDLLSQLALIGAENFYQSHVRQ